MKRTTIYEHWYEYKTERKPRFMQLQITKRNQDAIFELALIFTNNRWAKNTYVRDSLGRLVEAKIENEKYRIKEIIPYWKEELIYDFQKKSRIRYHEVLEQILSMNGIGQIFTLNNKLFVQIDDEIFLFGNKNIKDASRLFELIREDVLKKKKTNFIFVRDITTIQRKNLYKILEEKGYKRRELFRHYSY